MAEDSSLRTPLGSPTLPATLQAAVEQMRDRTKYMQMRIAIVTAIDAGGGDRKVQTDATSTAWLNRAQDMTLSVGDRVLLAKSGSVYVVLSRLTGAVSGPAIGSIMVWSQASAPAGWMVCSGASISRTTYAALFALIGTTYGSGDGSSTFGLPSITSLAATLPYIIRVL